MSEESGTDPGALGRVLRGPALLLVGLLVALHVRAWSDFPPDADPINFTLALSHFSIADEAPHAPGYPLYVALAQGAARLVGPAHAYQLVNLVMLLIGGAALTRAMRSLGMGAVGFAAALLAFSHPLVWSTSVIAECYVADAMFACLIMAWCVPLARRPRTLLPGVFVLFFLLGMIRPVSGAMLSGLAGACVLVRAWPRSWRLAFATGLIAVIGAACAWALTAQIAGGFAAYKAASDKVMGFALRANSVLGGAPASAHIAMLKKLFAWFLIVAGPPLAIGVLAGIAARIARPPRRWPEDQGGTHALRIVLLGMLMPLGFYAIVYYLKPSYLLIVLPGVGVVCAMALLRGLFARNQVFGWAAVLAITLGHTGAYFLAPRGLPEQLYRITARAVKDRDAVWRQVAALLRDVPRQDTLLVWDAPGGLSPLGARTLEWPDQVAVPAGAGNRVSFFAPYPNRGVVADEASLDVPPRYRRLAVLGTGPSGPTLRIREVRADESRAFAALMSPASGPASAR